MCFGFGPTPTRGGQAFVPSKEGNGWEKNEELRLKNGGTQEPNGVSHLKNRELHKQNEKLQGQ